MDSLWRGEVRSWYLSDVAELCEILAVLLLALLVAGMVVAIAELGWGGVVLDVVVLATLGTLGAVAVPRTPVTWDLPTLLPDRGWKRLQQARHNRGWGGVWGGDDDTV